MSEVVLDLSLDAIDPSDRLRPVDQATVQAIAASFIEQGQIQPITVRNHAHEPGRFHLVVGLHRLYAARKNGLSTIKAVVKALSAEAARLEEIDENLMRRELSPLDRSIFLAEREAVYLRMHPEAGHGRAKGKSNQHERKVAKMATFQSFAKDVAKRTGLSDRTIRRAKALTASLASETIDAIRSTPIADNGAALRKLAGIKDTATQIAVARSIAAGSAKTLKTAMAAHGLIAIEEAVDPAIAEQRRNEGRFQQWFAASKPKDRRTAILTILDNATAAEFSVLAKDLAKHLPHGERLKLKAYLDRALEGYELEQIDEEAA